MTSHILSSDRDDLYSDEPKFKPKCSCGTWRVDRWVSRDEAMRLGDEHLADVAVGAS